MQPPNFNNLPPPDLRTLLDNYETPWLISENLQRRLQPGSNRIYTKGEVRHGDPEWQFIYQYFSAQKPKGKSIAKAYCIHNESQKNKFEEHILLTEQRAQNPYFAPRWKHEAPDPLRDKVMARWNSLVAPYSPCVLPNKKKDPIVHTKVIPVWHGTKQAVCHSIFETSYNTFGKHAMLRGVPDGQNTDCGFFGSGIYFTTSADYAATIYSDGNLLLSWFSAAEPYPVVADKAYPQTPSDMQMLKGLGGYQNHNTHYIPVVSVNPANPKCSIYHPCTNYQDPICDEIVGFDSSQTYLCFWIQLQPDLTINPGLVIEDLQRYIHFFLFTKKSIQQEPHLHQLLSHKSQHLNSLKSVDRTLQPADLEFYRWSTQLLDSSDKINFFVQDMLEEIYNPKELLVQILQMNFVPSVDIGPKPGVYVFALCANETCSKFQLGEWIRYECPVDKYFDFYDMCGEGGVKCSGTCLEEFIRKDSIPDKIALCESSCEIEYRTAEKYGDKKDKLPYVAGANRAQIISWRIDSIEILKIKINGSKK